MVCQAASKTRFRALKHEYGIAGSATIVVRIIACFQPLQDCQAEYFRHLLKPVTIALRSMGGSFDPKFHRWMQNTGMNYGSNLVMPPYVGQPKLNPMEPPAYVNPFGCAFPRNEASGFNGFAAPHLGTYLMNLESSGVTDQKRFLVFDQSGYQTSLIYSSVAGPSCQNVDPLNVKAPELASFGARFEANRAPIVLSNETNVSSDDKGSQEMHEDTEEINALLYSESDYIHEQEEDEASTGHSPLDMTETSVQFADSSTHAKKRRLNRELDGALADSASSARHLHLNYNDAQSSCIRGSGEEGSKRLKRKRIQETVGVLRRIIPGGKGKDAAAVLDEAIQYLKSLKLRAKEGFGTSF